MPTSAPGYLARLVITTILALGAAAAALATSEYEDFNELDLEALLGQEIVTASRHRQKLSDAPVAATVITAEQIAASGARSIPELLRDVPGLDVIQTGSSAFDVSARGLNKPGSNGMLVLVDGRSVYVDVYGLTLWDMLSIGLEDIRTIEIIRGPGSVVHGANAFAGVINIITFDADDRPGATARVLASDLGESYGSLQYSRRHGAASWRLSSSWDRAENWEQGRVDSDVVRVNGRYRHDLGERTWVEVHGGHTNGRTSAIVDDEPLRGDGNNSHLTVDAFHGDWSARWSSSRFEVDMEPVYPLLSPARIEGHRHELELQHAFDLGDGHHLVWGGRYRRSCTRYGDDAERATDIYAGYLLEEWTPRPDLTISAGLRYEDHPRVGDHLAPRGGIVWKTADDQAWHVSVGRAYRNPSYAESYLVTEFDRIPGLTQIVCGDIDNSSEIITAYEIGFRGLLTADMLLQASAFRNEIDDIILTEVVATFPSPPAPFAGIPSEVAFLNGPSWLATGGELSLQADLADWLRLDTRYSYVWLEDADSGEHQERAPVHTAGIAATVRPALGHQIRLAMRFRSDSQWRQDYVPSDLSEERTTLDAIWHVKLDGGDRRLTLAAHNLLDRRFRDHPLAIEQRRRLLMSIALAF